MKIIILHSIKTIRGMRKSYSIAKRRINYKKFLLSEKWRSIRIAAISFYKFCAFCGSTRDLEVHHRDYTRFGGDEKIYDLAVLCKKDHKDLSYKNGKKRSLAEQEKIFKQKTKL